MRIEEIKKEKVELKKKKVLHLKFDMQVRWNVHLQTFSIRMLETFFVTHKKMPMQNKTKGPAKNKKSESWLGKKRVEVPIFDMQVGWYAN